MQGKSHDPVALAVPSVTGESWHSPLLGNMRIPRCHTHRAAVRAAVRARPSTLQEQPHPPTWRHAGRRGGLGRPAAARIPSRELASALCSARHPPSEAWASWGMFVGKEEEEDSAATGSRLWLLWGLSRACWAHGYGTGAPWVSPGRPSPLNCDSLSCPQPARSGALGRRRPQRASSYLCTSWVPTPHALTPSRSFWAGLESSVIPTCSLGFQPWVAGLGTVGRSCSLAGDFLST